MQPCTLPLPAGYAPEGAPSVALLAAELDEQLRVLEKRLAGADVAALEWQLRPGVNTAGMLLAHLAVAEAYWFHAVLQGKTGRDAADGGHPASLRGWTLADYLALLGRARAATHDILRTWSDGDLARTVEPEDGPLSRAWIVFHVTDHFAHHAGQISLLRSLRGTA